jgi:hypothetical protein
MSLDFVDWIADGKGGGFALWRLLISEEIRSSLASTWEVKWSGRLGLYVRESE